MDQQELRALEAQCIQECAPPCAAACPIHVDVRAVLRDFGAGEEDAALRTLRRTLPFPGIIGRICEQPCRAVCKRGEAGDPIAIAAIERACADFAVQTPEKARPLPRRTQRIAIAGGGLAGLTAALDLGRKGYRITIFEALHPVGGRLWSYPDDALPRATIVDELGQIEALGVEIRLNTPVCTDPGQVESAGPTEGAPGECGTRISLDDLRGEYDAVLVAVGAEADGEFGLELGPDGRIAVDPVTFATSREGVFAAGSLLRAANASSAIDSIADGRRAAISIDRYVQSVSLTASREGEGHQVSCLYTRTDEIAPLPLVPLPEEGRGYGRADAQREAQRCIQCECLECVKVCEYLDHFGRYPRKAVREVYNNLSIVKGERHANRLINSCSLCGLCAEACPTDFDMGEVNRQSRVTMVAQNRMPLSAHDFALRDMAFSQSEHFALARNAPGESASDVVFFPGCQLSGASPEHVERVYGYLRAVLAPARVGLLLGCCGSPADWAGRKDVLESTVAGLRAEHERLGSPTVVLACSSCYRAFGQQMPEIDIRSLWEVMAEHGVPAGAPDGAGRTISIHDACATRHEAGLQESIRTLLGELDYKVEELPRSRERTTCCSYGGHQWLANPDVGGKVVAARIAESHNDYVAYCAMCRDFLVRGGKPTVHLLDLVFGVDFDRQARQPATGWSERHENRARLKRHLLETIWSEQMGELEPHETIVLRMSDEVARVLESRLILVEDVQRVLLHANETGRRMIRRETGHFLSSYKPAAVTYWVEYTMDGGTFIVHNAYSHRMEIVQGIPGREHQA